MTLFQNPLGGEKGAVRRVLFHFFFSISPGLHLATLPAAWIGCCGGRAVQGGGALQLRTTMRLLGLRTGTWWTLVLEVRWCRGVIVVNSSSNRRE